MDMRYGIFCPVAKAAEVVASRWTPLILSELMKGRERFIDIQQGVPLMSRSLLSRRLKEMEISNLIQRVPQGRGHVYRLTEAGNALRPLINQLAAWGSTRKVHAAPAGSAGRCSVAVKRMSAAVPMPAW